MKKFFVLVAALCLAQLLSAQTEKEAFKPSGKPVIKVFTDWHQGLGDQTFKDESGFELTRAVLGYEHYFSEHISTKVIVDMDDPGANSKMTEVAYLRNAYVAYKDDRLNVVFGVLGMKQFKTQEDNWGYRYLYKSAMDHYKFNNSVDAGLYVKYKVLDWAILDVSVTNGEGAKSQQDIEGKYRMGYGFELEPLKNLTFRTYYDYFYAPEMSVPNENQATLSLFLGYETDKYRLGIEYDNLSNFDFDGNDDREIFSVYGSYVFSKKMQAFARYDYLIADVANETEQVYMAGVEYSPVKGVKVSPNFRYGDYAFSSPTGEGAYVYLNFEYKF